MKKVGQKPSVTFYIKNMVCNRCIRVVREELEKLQLDVRRISLGEVEVTAERPLDIGEVRRVLAENGFELIEDKKAKTIERIKHLIIGLVHDDRPPLKERYSQFLSTQLQLDYHYLSTLFSSVENITIEQFIILQKIERVKELLKYGELTLGEIAFKLGYSSVAHLSNQFKKITGMTPTRFKSLGISLRKPIDRVAGNL